MANKYEGLDFSECMDLVKMKSNALNSTAGNKDERRDYQKVLMADLALLFEQAYRASRY